MGGCISCLHCYDCNTYADDVVCQIKVVTQDADMAENINFNG